MRKESAISVSAPGEQPFNKDEWRLFLTKAQKKRQTFVYPTNNSHLCIRFRAIAVRKKQREAWYVA